MGVAYKRDIDDVRESPALDVMHLLEKRGATISYTDPHVPSIRVEHGTLEAKPREAVKDADCAVIITDHSDFDYNWLLENAALIVDTRNAMKGLSSPKLVRL
jgi:UDP-N-acetyl-D-glucosamine dehydrogenase